MAPEESDPSRYYLEDLEEGIKGKYTNKQLETVLSEFGHDEFPSNGIDNDGADKVWNRLAEVDAEEAKLQRTERKNLSSKVTTVLKKREIAQAALAGVLSIVVLGGIIAWSTFGRRIHYNQKYKNAVQIQELTQEENEMRSEIFNFFNEYRGWAGLPRINAATNQYFLTVKETGLTKNNAIQLIKQVPKYGLRQTATWASKYAKALQERGIPFVESLYFLYRTSDVNLAIRLMDLQKDIKNKGIPYNLENNKTFKKHFGLK